MSSSSNELVITDSLLPDIFLVKYAQELSKEAIIVYLWLNMSGDGANFDSNTIKQYGIIPSNVIDKVISELITKNLINSKDDKYSFVDLKRTEVDEYVSISKARGGVNANYELTDSEKNNEVLANSISKTFYQGKMFLSFYRLIDKCLYEYKFDSAVCYKLFEEGFESGIHRFYNPMEKKALDWYEKGYTTVERLEEHLKEDADIKKMIAFCGRMTRKRLDQMDIERITSWVHTFKYDTELVNYAFRANEYREKVTLLNVEATLKKWYEAGVDSIEKATKYEEEEHAENKRKSVRRRSAGSRTSWKTGADVGIDKDNGADTTAIADNKDNNGGVLPEGVLGMFGGDDEND